VPVLKGKEDVRGDGHDELVDGRLLVGLDIAR
jgi:hypothetical protein